MKNYNNVWTKCLHKWYRVKQWETKIMAAVMEQWSHAGTSFLSLFFLHDYDNIYVW